MKIKRYHIKQVCVFITALLVVSCEYFNVKKTTSEAILTKELKTFNWNDVDVYPTFSVCDTVEGKENKTTCFTDVLTTHILQQLQQAPIIVTHEVTDTLNLKFQLSETGVLALLTIEADSLIVKEIPNIKALVHASLDSLPKVFPAIKRGQQVKTEFQLPLIIQAH